jgi:hypothetical protein
MWPRDEDEERRHAAPDAQATPKTQMIIGRDGRPTRKRVGGPVVLNARMVRMIDLMINGHADDPSHTPYGLYDAAANVGYRRMAARGLAKGPVFVDAYNAAVAAWSRDYPPPNPCPSLADVREQMVWRQLHNETTARRIDAQNHCKQLHEEIALLKEEIALLKGIGSLTPALNTPGRSAGYVIRMESRNSE